MHLWSLRLKQSLFHEAHARTCSPLLAEAALTQMHPSGSCVRLALPCLIRGKRMLQDVFAYHIGTFRSAKNRQGRPAVTQESDLVDGWPLKNSLNLSAQALHLHKI